MLDNIYTWWVHYYFLYTDRKFKETAQLQSLKFKTSMVSKNLMQIWKSVPVMSIRYTPFPKWSKCTDCALLESKDFLLHAGNYRGIRNTEVSHTYMQLSSYVSSDKMG